jgi:hypothetical protein
MALLTDNMAAMVMISLEHLYLRTKIMSQNYHQQVLPSGFCVNNLVLESIENGVVNRQHGRDGDDLFGTFVPEDKNYTTKLSTCSAWRCLRVQSLSLGRQKNGVH